VASRPLIGITASTLSAGEHRPRGFKLNQSYARAVAFAGGAPVLIPALGEDESLRAIFESIDGLLLPGGGDVDPAAYGAARHSSTEESDADLDATELSLARWALTEAKPVLGICRGQQVLNVAAGGTLVQDVPTLVPDALVHQFEPRNAMAHPIVIEADSRLADLVGSTRIEVNSLHHQAVDRVAPGWVVVARAPDGVIEAIERPDHRFAVSVQFHPEELVPGHEASERLFQRFIAEAGRR
jgi:putative glutamine amidotransferase